METSGSARAEARKARVLHSSDLGKTWSVAETPIAAGKQSAGIFSISFRDRLHGVIVGGDYLKPEANERVAATTSDGGKTWSLIAEHGPTGYRSAVAFLPVQTLQLGSALVHQAPTSRSTTAKRGNAWQDLASMHVHSPLLAKLAGQWAIMEPRRVGLQSLMRSRQMRLRDGMNSKCETVSSTAHFSERLRKKHRPRDQHTS